MEATPEPKPLTPEEEEIIANEWGEIHQKFLKDIKDFVKKHGGPKRVAIRCAGPYPSRMMLLVG